MSEKFNTLVYNNTSALVPPHPSQNIVRCQWIYKIKCNLDGSISRYKACLVANRFYQCPDIDFHDTFSPIVKPTTIRTVLTIVVTWNWPI